VKVFFLEGVLLLIFYLIFLGYCYWEFFYIGLDFERLGSCFDHFK